MHFPASKRSLCYAVSTRRSVIQRLHISADASFSVRAADHLCQVLVSVNLQRNRGHATWSYTRSECTLMAVVWLLI